ncbi:MULTISPECIES: hypothetical protein [Thalassospira]|uniref:Uncharacterized protein n=2 Tax=Thalassospira TaxID=168934 RepID=A0A367W2S6_9PROT|nr:MULTISPECIES: hypothetical protein [Thalassospira]MDG4718362.1 hypothetical protein [Thalassospira sp. FZY0004]RCK34716.1 hypothetical protein TH19_15905 [Thalassospira profundimaris]
MAYEATSSVDIMMLAGLTWERTGKNCWAASDRFAQYTIFRDIDERWYGEWERDGERTRANWSCPILETFAEYMVDHARRSPFESPE